MVTLRALGPDDAPALTRIYSGASDRPTTGEALTLAQAQHKVHTSLARAAEAAPPVPKAGLGVGTRRAPHETGRSGFTCGAAHGVWAVRLRSGCTYPYRPACRWSTGV